jgi:hypothetical protein
MQEEPNTRADKRGGKDADAKRDTLEADVKAREQERERTVGATRMRKSRRSRGSKGGKRQLVVVVEDSKSREHEPPSAKTCA